jgi:hypothetical protein
LKIVANPEEPNVMSALAQRMGDLVLHFWFVRAPGADLTLHLLLVVRVVPPAVWGIEDDSDPHG